MVLVLFAIFPANFVVQASLITNYNDMFTISGQFVDQENGCTLFLLVTQLTDMYTLIVSIRVIQV